MKKYNDPATLKEHLALEMKNPAFRKEWDRIDPEFSLMEALVDLRQAKGLSQRELAKLAKATQAQIARIERGSNTTFNTLQRIAKATGKKLVIAFK